MAYGDYGKTTELEAINIMLSVIGEQPVSAVPSSGLSVASIARDILYEYSREVQTEGLLCNTQKDYPLIPDESDHCVLPANTLDVDADEWWHDYVERDSMLYDREENTDEFSETIQVTITFFLAWTKLPQHVRRYINILGARAFQERFVADEALWKFSEDDESKALRQMKRKEDNNSELSIFDNMFMNRGVLRRS
jgi:hypothetical protein